MDFKTEITNIGIFIAVAFAVWFVTWLIARRLLVPIVHKIIKKTRFDWDDILAENKVFIRLAHAVPALALYKFTEVFAQRVSVKITSWTDLLYSQPTDSTATAEAAKELSKSGGLTDLADKVANDIANTPVGEIFSSAPVQASEILAQLTLFVSSISLIYLIFAILFAASAFLNSANTLYNKLDVSQNMPIKGFIQVAKIILWAIAIIFTLSVIMGKKPGYFLTGLGAMTAILLLIFKDSILGLVAGIQLSTNKMIRVGDWIEMPRYGADGDVIDISLTTLKVQNFDKTITTIPTYSMVTDSFKNWRGMSESAGRRIKRSINIDMSSVKFCDDGMIEKFKRFHNITKYIEDKQNELRDYNEKNNIDSSEMVNGRRMTNLGTFRAYLEGYLHNHPMINTDLTFLVRHLQPTETGLPIEIYIFCRDKRWTNYEGIQADIFDHILAVIPEFELRVFQNPTGSDFAKL